MKKVLAFLGVLLLGVTVGAATGVKITAELKNQKINFNGNLSNQEIISYKGSTYVPLRAFSNLVNIPVNYKDGIIYLGEDNSKNIAYWGKDIKDMNSKDAVYQYDGNTINDNIGNTYSNYFVNKYGTIDANLELPLLKKYTKFKATIAIPEKYRNGNGSTLIISVDNKEVYNKFIKCDSMPSEINIDISGADKISFKISPDYAGELTGLGLFNGQFIK